MYRQTLSVEEMCRRLRPLFGKRIDQLYLRYAMTDDRSTKTEIEQAIQALYQKHLSSSLLDDALLLEPPRKEVIQGKYPLGEVVYGSSACCTFGLRERDWMRHVCVTGMSGSGKTTFAFQILGNFIFQKKPFLVFDWKKSFRSLTKLNEKLRVYTIGNEHVANFKLNINKPPKGVDPKEWINLLADIITETFSASFGVHKLLVETLDKAFQDFGVFAGSGNYPTWLQVRDRLEERANAQTRKTRESEWLESALRIAYALTFGTFGKTICYKGADAHAVEDLFQEEVVMELASLSNTEKKFFTQFILSYIYKWAKAGGVHTTESFRFAILVDEAHNIFLKDRPTFISESIADVIFREIREYGVSLITLDQHMSKLSDVVAGNSATNVAFQQMLPQDIDAVSRLMQLQDHKEYFTQLPVGSAIVRLVERFHRPFLIRAPLVKLKFVSVDDASLRERMRLLLAYDRRKVAFEESVRDEVLAKKVQDLRYVFGTSGVRTDDAFLEEQARLSEAARVAEEAQDAYLRQERAGPAGIGLRNHLQQKIFEDVKKRCLNGESFSSVKKWYAHAGYRRSDVLHVMKYIKEKGFLEKWQTGSKKSIQKQEPLSLSDEELAFLRVIRDHPSSPVSSLYQKAGLSPRKGNALKKRLEDEGIVEVVEQRYDRGWKKLLRIRFTEEITALLTTQK